jgi:hypothetical protein
MILINKNMSKKKIKFKDLIKAESYLQINLIKGFTYVDSAGKILNLYAEENRVPDHRVGLQGMVISQPTKDISEIKISSEVIWAKFNKIDSLDFITNKFISEAKRICRILDVERINRIGFRNFFVHEFKKEDDMQNKLNSMVNLDKLTLEEIRGKYKLSSEFESVLFIKSVVKNDKTKQKGIGIDVDNFSKKVENIEDAEVVLKSINRSFKETNFEDLINKIVNG